MTLAVLLLTLSMLFSTFSLILAFTLAALWRGGGHSVSHDHILSAEYRTHTACTQSNGNGTFSFLMNSPYILRLLYPREDGRIHYKLFCYSIKYTYCIYTYTNIYMSYLVCCPSCLVFLVGWYCTWSYLRKEEFNTIISRPSLNVESAHLQNTKNIQHLQCIMCSYYLVSKLWERFKLRSCFGCIYRGWWLTHEWSTLQTQQQARGMMCVLWQNRLRQMGPNQ